MKKPFFISILILICIASMIIYFYSPMKIEKISIKTDKNLWNEKIAELITSKISINTEYNSERAQEIKEFIESLPWVKSANISFIKGNLSISVEEEPIKYCITTGNNTFVVGYNGFILSTKKDLCTKIYFYKGKIPIITTTKTGFLKLKNSIQLEIELISNYLNQINPIKEEPNILLTDEGIKLLYPQKKLIIFLGNNLKTWQNFKKLFTILDKPYEGFYDFRFSDILIKQGDKK